MNQYDVAGVLRTYSEQIAHAYSKERVKEIIKELKEELDLRKIKFLDSNGDEH